jgi:hypothetical protein
VDDLGRELESLTSAATRGVVVPPVEQVRRRARQSRRQVIGAGAGVVAVVAIVVGAALAGGGSPSPTPNAPARTPAPTSSLKLGPLKPILPTGRPSTSALPPPASIPAVPDAAMLTAGDVGAGWRASSEPLTPSEVRFDPCGDGDLGAKPGAQRLRRFTSDSGEVLEHVMAYSGTGAPDAMEILRKAVERCGGATPGGGAGAVTYVNRGALSPGTDSMVLHVKGGPQDPITTYVSVVRVGNLLMTLQDTRTGVPYTESAHRALAQKAVGRLPH